jgi:predicted oxidoreductase (fatty acid repression mutant protein)
MRNLTNKEIIKAFEDEGVETTDNLNEAIYILSDGTLISGMFFDGDRTEDHRIIEVLFDDIDRYTPNFWNIAHKRTGMIQHVPETSYILKTVGQEVTTEQQNYFNQVDFVEII